MAEAATAGPVVRIRGLTVALPAGADRAHAVEDLDLEAGRILCVVGESGSGKSTTARLAEPDGGSLRLGDLAYTVPGAAAQQPA